MAAPSVRTLDQILAEIGTVYNPQIQSVQTRLNDIPNQIKAEEQGLSAQKDQAFGNILDGARRRGLGFSGIPLGEQAKYTATDYLPALARLRQSGKEQAMSLQDAINQIQERRQSQALGLQQYDQQRYDAYESEQRQLAAQREAAARAAASPTYGGGAVQQPNAAQPTDPLQQVAYNDVRTRVSAQSDQELLSDYMATASSAKYGNQKDLYKLQIYRSLRPDLFKSAYQWEATNGYRQPSAPAASVPQLAATQMNNILGYSNPILGAR